MAYCGSALLIDDQMIGDETIVIVQLNDLRWLSRADNSLNSNENIDIFLSKIQFKMFHLCTVWKES